MSDEDPRPPPLQLDGVLSDEERTLAFLAHELRTPLSGISGLMALMHEGAVGPLTPRQRAVVDLARRNVQHLECVVAEFLDFAALETGTLRLRPTTVRVGPVVDEVVALLRPDAEERGVHLAQRVRPAALQATLDATRFREVLFNLLGNAIRHSPRGGRVDVVVTTDEAGLSLVVGDEGDGVSEAMRPSLFKGFEGDGGGAGLGLSVVQGIVQAQGGDVSVHEGAPGAVFRVRLPHVEAEDGREPRPPNDRL